MFICKTAETYHLLNEPQGTVIAELLPPFIEEGGVQAPAADSGFSGTDKLIHEKDGLFCLKRRLENHSGRLRAVKMITALRMEISHKS